MKPVNATERDNRQLWKVRSLMHVKAKSMELHLSQ